MPARPLPAPPSPTRDRLEYAEIPDGSESATPLPEAELENFSMVLGAIAANSTVSKTNA